MAIVINCAQCGTQISFDDAHAGQQGACGACGREILITAPTAAAQQLHTSADARQLSTVTKDAASAAGQPRSTRQRSSTRFWLGIAAVVLGAIVSAGALSAYFLRTPPREVAENGKKPIAAARVAAADQVKRLRRPTVDALGQPAVPKAADDEEPLPPEFYVPDAGLDEPPPQGSSSLTDERPDASPIPTAETSPRPENLRPVATPANPPSRLPRPQPPRPRPADAHPLVGQQASILHLVRDKLATKQNVTIAGLDPGKVAGTYRNVQFHLPADDPQRAKPRVLPLEGVIRIVAEDRPYEVRFDESKDAHTLVDVVEHRQKVNAELAKSGRSLWKQLSPEEHAAAVAEYKEYLGEVNSRFGGGLQLLEKQHFLFLTDMPASEAELSVQYLDVMYQQLCTMFGVMPGENIWRGKAVVIAFRQESDFHAFERTIMGNPKPEGAYGIHHGFGDGKVIIACFRGNEPAVYRQMLVHETAHGFLHRYLSNVHVISWINEGIADWVADFAVRDCSTVDNRRQSARRQVLQSRTIGDTFFTARNIDAWQYGIASDMTDVLLQIDAARFRVFLDGIKEGKTWETSLSDSYDMTPEGLMALYVQTRVAAR